MDDAYRDYDSRFASDSSEVDVTADILLYIRGLGKHSVLKSGANRAVLCVLVWHRERGWFSQIRDIGAIFARIDMCI